MDTLIILGIVIAVMILVSRAAGNPLHHSQRFRRRRLLNWLPMGLMYAFLYMGRYNLTQSKIALGKLMSKEDFGKIFGAGAMTYAFSFLINGPLTDRMGGKRAMLIGGAGSALMNGALAVLTYLLLTRPELSLNVVLAFSLIYSLNMYFQSFGAVAIVKVNSHWFHVRERGGFGGIFGTLISLGIYFAFDWSAAVIEASRLNPSTELGLFQGILHRWITSPGQEQDKIWWVFGIPALLLLVFFIVESFLLCNKPSEAGLEDFDTSDASSGEGAETFRLLEVLKKIFSNKIIWTIAFIEFCSGVLRNGIMHWYPIYLREMGLPSTFLFSQHWGLLLAVAGSSGGIIAGLISDKIFASRRGPVAALLYGSMGLLVGVMIFSLKADMLLGTVAMLISTAVIGVHGMLSGTATMDFGGRKAAATAVGIIDGFVYLGTSVQSISLGYLTSKDWSYWPVFLLPFALLGLFLSLKIWQAFPGAAKGAAGAH
jgi:OPA family glycerol-3-phosphate transporter-like MFS transporter